MKIYHGGGVMIKGVGSDISVFIWEERGSKKLCVGVGELDPGR